MSGYDHHANISCCIEVAIIPMELLLIMSGDDIDAHQSCCIVTAAWLVINTPGHLSLFAIYLTGQYCFS